MGVQHAALPSIAESLARAAVRDEANADDPRYGSLTEAVGPEKPLGLTTGAGIGPTRCGGRPFARPCRRVNLLAANSNATIMTGKRTSGRGPWCGPRVGAGEQGASGLAMQSMSAITPKSGRSTDTPACPRSSNNGHRSISFDYRVRSLLKMQRHVEAKRLGRFEVDHQLELDRGLDRKLARLRTLEDVIRIGRRAPKIVG